MSCLANIGIVYVFDKDKCMFYRFPKITGTGLGHAPHRGGLYYLSDVRVKNHIPEKCNKADIDLMVWHRIFNHTKIQKL